MKKRAFTLAEVLIALAIIGVIAAITVPALIQRTNKQEYVTALQKAYSTLSQVTNQIIAEEGSPKGDESWYNNVDDLYNMYKNHLNIVLDCGVKSGCLPQFGTEKNGYKLLAGTKYTSNWNTSSTYRKVVLNDGMQIVFMHYGNTCSNNLNGSNNRCATIQVDINGSKQPNQLGRDLFTFVLKEDGLYPNGCDDDRYCNPSGNADTYGSGYGCACRVLREGAMNY